MTGRLCIDGINPENDVTDDAAGVDGHHHFWSLRDGDYGWIRNRLSLPNMARLKRDFEAPEFCALLAQNGIRRSLLVQTEKTVIETDQMLARARGSDFVAGVIGWVDFDQENAADQIAARAEDPLIKGLRIWLLDRPETTWIFDAAARGGLEASVRMGMPLEILPAPHQIGDVLALIERRGLDRVAICHAAKPDVAGWNIGSTAFANWSDGMRALAEAGCFAKVSGLVTECGDDWDVAAIRPYWDVLLRRFGPSRLIWGSDWPVIDRAGGYSKWLGAVRELAADLPPADRQAIFGGAAIGFYRL